MILASPYRQEGILSSCVIIVRHWKHYMFIMEWLSKLQSQNHVEQLLKMELMTFAGTQNYTSDIVFKKDPKLYRYHDYSTTLFKQMYEKKG